MIIRLLLDVLLARRVLPNEPIIPDTKPLKLNNDHIQTDPHQATTYEKCIENGVLYLTQEKNDAPASIYNSNTPVRVDIPIYGLINMELLWIR
jgi:hypothetical protein